MVTGQTYNTVAGLNNNVELLGGFFRVVVSNIGDSLTGMWQPTGQDKAIEILLYVSSASADGLLLRHNNAASLGGNRLMLYNAQDLIIAPGMAAFFVYSPSLAAWYIYTFGTQRQTDWNATSGVSQLLNKPTSNSAFTNGAGYITNITSGMVTAALTYTPYNSSNPSSYITQAGARTAISLTTTGSGAATYNNSTGSLNVPTPPTAKRQETYSGTTNASGNYTVTFSVAYAVAPNIQASISNQSNVQYQIRVSAVSTTGFTINVNQRNTAFLSLLGLDILTAGVTNISGAVVDVLVTEK